MTLNDLHKMYTKDSLSISDKQIKFYGWIRRTRIGGAGSIVFIDIYDGTKVGCLMCLASAEQYVGEKFVKPKVVQEFIEPIDIGISKVDDTKNLKTLTFEQLGSAEQLSAGCAVVVDGKLVLSPDGATQKFELQIYYLRVIGGIDDPTTYPIQKSTDKHISSLRQLPFMRVRSQVMQSIFRICSKLELAVHMFMDQNDVEKVDPNIITVSDCEGAGDTFMVSPSIFSKDTNGKEIPVGLTVSSQLPLEALITGLRSVYTAQKSFRAEKSDTNKHLAEFFHVEFERAFITLSQLMDFTENFVKYIIDFTFSRCKEDFDFLQSKFAPSDMKSTQKLLQKLITKSFIRIKYCDAIELIQKLIDTKYMLPDENGKMKRVRVDKYPKQGDDLGAEHEKILVRYFGLQHLTQEEQSEMLKLGEEIGAFVFVTHWPIKIKSFYMKQCDDSSGECESFDLLAPCVGELFGGSMREWRYEHLMNEVQTRKMNITPIQWFVDLRKSGSMPHGGWGMGFARMCMLLTGVTSVRDVVAFPVYYTHCPY